VWESLYTQKNGSFHLQYGGGIAEKYFKWVMLAREGIRKKTFSSYSFLP
jgi:hypothetical protein